MVAGPHDSLKGLEHCDKVIDIDQSPIGRTPRSNPATYTGAFSIISDWFAGLPESQARGYKPGRFSLNVKGGRCETCTGAIGSESCRERVCQYVQLSVADGPSKKTPQKNATNKLVS